MSDSAERDDREMEPLCRFGDAHGEHIGTQPCLEWQQAFAPLLTRVQGITGNFIISQR